MSRTRKFIDPNSQDVIREMAIVLYGGMRRDFYKLPLVRIEALKRQAHTALRRLPSVPVSGLDSTP